MITDGFAEVHLALRARLEAVGELPTWRAWENVENGVQSNPPLTEPHVDEKFDPNTGRMLSYPARHGWVEYTGFYFVGVYAPTNRGSEPIRDILAGILPQFPPAYAWVLDSGDRLEIRGDDVVPLPGPILPDGRNKSRSLVAIPWRVWTPNAFPSS